MTNSTRWKVEGLITRTTANLGIQPMWDVCEYLTGTSRPRNLQFIAVPRQNQMIVAAYKAFLETNS